jgi:hypothetical protein
MASNYNDLLKRRNLKKCPLYYSLRVPVAAGGAPQNPDYAHVDEMSFFEAIGGIGGFLHSLAVFS